MEIGMNGHDPVEYSEVINRMKNEKNYDKLDIALKDFIFSLLKSKNVNINITININNENKEE